MRFKRHVGIDYSGGKYPTTRLPGLQLYEVREDNGPVRTGPPPASLNVRNWTRATLAKQVQEILQSAGPVVIGIDHGFSFPCAYMNRYQIKTWDNFLDDFVRHWHTDCSNKSVAQLMCGNQRTGERNEFRLCEEWTSSAKSVFDFTGPGVAHSTHAGLPWLRWLRKSVSRDRVHFWPFDGFCVGDDKSVVAEVYPSLFSRRYAKVERTEHQHDAWSVARWLREMDGTDRLNKYFLPPLTPDERCRAKLEGWILGVS